MKTGNWGEPERAPHRRESCDFLYIIGASAAKPHMDDTFAIFHWGERSEAPHGWYIWDFSYIIDIVGPL